MWTVPSRGRPRNLARLIAACRTTGMSTTAVVMLDNDDPTRDEALDLPWPADWSVLVQARAPLADRYNSVLEFFGRQSFWGFLADDVVPETPGWDQRLVEVAAGDGLAAPAGAHDGASSAPHFALGGDLVHSTGWLALPGLSRLYIDTVWGDIARERGTYRPVPDVVLAHHHFSNRRARLDATYRKPLRASDRALYTAWRRSTLGGQTASEEAT